MCYFNYLNIVLFFFTLADWYTLYNHVLSQVFWIPLKTTTAIIHKKARTFKLRRRIFVLDNNILTTVQFNEKSKY